MLAMSPDMAALCASIGTALAHRSGASDAFTGSEGATMRIALLLLIVANLLAFAWGQGWLVPITGDVRQPERMSRQVGPDRLRVLGPGDRARTERAVAGRVEAEEPAREPARDAADRPGPVPERAAPASRSGSPLSPSLASPGPNGGNRNGNETGRTGNGADRPQAGPPPSMPPTPASPGLPGAPGVSDAAVAPTPEPAASPAAAVDGDRPAGASGPGSGAVAPALPFGLAEPPITAALAGDDGRLASATGTGPAPASGAGPAGPTLPVNMESGLWPAALASADPAAQACFDLRGLDRVRAEAARSQLEGMGAASIEEIAVENRSGYIVYLPPSETVEQALGRIEQLREQGVSDIYLIPDGTYRLAISLGVFNRMDSVDLLIDRLRARGVEDAEVGFVNPAATRVTLRVRGPASLLDEAEMRAMANLRSGQLVRCS